VQGVQLLQSVKTGADRVETNTRVPQPAFELPAEPADAATPVGLPLNYEEAARSEENILQWMSYLPEDCIRTMIDMGWDITT
jgi:hypothetical protein